MLTFDFPDSSMRAVWTSSDQGDVLAQWGGEARLATSSPLHAVLSSAFALPSDPPGVFLRSRQVHSSVVIDATLIDGDRATLVADGLSTRSGGPHLASFTADCTSIALFAPESGAYAAVHGGWRGLTGGVVGAAAATLRGDGVRTIVGAVGPYIHPECYEFLGDAREEVLSKYGPSVFVGVDRSQLDMEAVLERALQEADVDLLFDAGICTGCSSSYASARVDQTSERFLLVVGEVGG